MSVAWQKMPFLAPSKGLLRRAGTQIDDPYYAQTAMNLEYLGGVVAKRYGTKLVSGVVAQVSGGSTSSAVKVSNTYPFLSGDVVEVYQDPTTVAIGTTKTVSSITFGSPNTLNLSSALAFTPVAGTSIVVARRALGPSGVAGTGTPGRVDAMASITFRDGVQRLLVSAGGVLWIITLATQIGAKVFLEIPTTTAGAWGSGASGVLTSVQGLQVGDWIYDASVTAPKTVRVTSIVGTTVTVSPAFGSAPVAADPMVFLPTGGVGDTTFVQYANVTHVATVQPAGAPTTVAPIPPVKYIEPGSVTGVIQRHGIKPPRVTPTTSTAAGAITLAVGTTYRITFRNSSTGQESEASAASASTGAVAAKKITVTFTAAATPPDLQVDKIRIYRTSDGGAGVWYFVGEVAYNVTSFDDNTPETALSTTQLREFLDVTIPDTVSVIALWPQANRLVAIDGVNRVVDPVTGVESINGGIVRFSDQPDTATGRLKGESWPADNTIFIDYDDGDALVGIAAFYDALVVFKQRSIWRITGIPPNLTIEPLNFRSDLTSIGALNQKSIVVDQNEMLFASYDGVYVIDRYAGVQTGFQANRLSRPIEDTWLTFDTTVRRKAHGVYFRDRRQYRAWVPFSDNPTSIDGDESMGRALLYQFDSDLEGKEGGWSEWVLRQLTGTGFDLFEDNVDVTASCVAQQLGTAGPDLVYVGTAGGLIYQLDATDVQGDFSGIVQYGITYQTVATSPAGAGIPARARAIDLVVQQVVGATGGTLFLSIVSEFGLQTPAAATIGLTVTPIRSYRQVMLTRGMKLALVLTEQSTLPRVTLLQGELWFQPLPVAAKAVDALQSSVTYAVGV